MQCVLNFFIIILFDSYLRPETGGKYYSRMSPSTNLVVIPGDGKKKSKLIAAEERGIEIWSEDKWLNCVESGLGSTWRESLP